MSVCNPEDCKTCKDRPCQGPLYELVEPELERHILYGSLFTGIGGFDEGFNRAGMQCAWQVEIDDACNRVLERRFPGPT